MFEEKPILAASISLNGSRQSTPFFGLYTRLHIVYILSVINTSGTFVRCGHSFVFCIFLIKTFTVSIFLTLCSFSHRTSTTE